MAELVEDEGPVEITVPEARLDDAGRRKFIQFYEKKPVLRDTSLKLSNPTSRSNNSFPISSFFIFQIVH